MSGLFSSSIGRKFIMSVTGACLALFLLFHMSMNLVAAFSRTGYDAVCEFLGTNWYALAGTAVLAFLCVVHIIYAFILTLMNRAARGNDRYAVNATPRGVEWASQNMLVIGIIVLVGIGLHLSHFWYKMMFAELAGIEGNAYGATAGTAWIEFYFGKPLVALLYIVWLVALWFHLTHGFWSALQTLGWNNLVWLQRVRTISNVYATVVCAGFAIVVIGFALGIFPLAEKL